ncbi:MAG TPA: chemotaxis protein CheA [Vicinamibacterales bacterium]|jgi:two-component system chemotaxis sensor kinase CheA
MQIDMNRFRATFFDEAAEHVDNLESGLLRLESEPGDPALLDDIFRSAHSIKGGSATFGLEAVARFTHSLETVLDRMRGGQLGATPDLTALLLQAVDALKGLLATAKAGGQPQGAEDEVSARLTAFLASADAESVPRPGSARPTPAREDERPRTSGPADAPAEALAAAGAATADASMTEFDVSFVPSRDLFRQGMDPLLLLRDLAGLGTVVDTEADLSALPPLHELDPESCHLAWRVRVRTGKGAEALRDVFLFVEDDCRITIAPVPALNPAIHEGPAASAGDRRAGGDRRATAAPLESSSMRVDTHKVDKLVDLVGELVISQSMLGQALSSFTIETLPVVLAAAGDLERHMRELQERVMAIRMVPIGAIFSRFPRLVHDLSTACGKKVQLEVSGADTELDKAVVERLSDPLTHLIRNAIDHGIESTEGRRRAGKPEDGCVRLHARYESGGVVVEVSDDGRGLDDARIREKAVALGWLGADEQVSPEQLHAFVFQPGFSTAATVSDVSGRGVGMDVVRRNVEALNGNVGIATQTGRGTTFKIRLPLTLAILDGLQLGVGDQVYVLPLTAIIESLRPRPDQVRPVLGHGEVVDMRGELVPLVRLHRVFDVSPRETDPSRGLVVLVEVDGRRFGLLVDELLGQSQVVIKSLETHYRKVEGVTAATILGNGKVALILDAQGLLRMALRQPDASRGMDRTAHAAVA